MAEALLEYSTILSSSRGRLFCARAWGAKAGDGTRRWKGWLEFVPLDGAAPVLTAYETTQPDRACTIYWSTGLSPAYLEGALGRALKAPMGRAVCRVVRSAPRRAAKSAVAAPARSRQKTARRVVRTTTNGWSLNAWDRWLLKSLAIRPE